ncbi:MAG: nitroreductase/quinone reductase family protein [Acidimicrobiales bacterium]
MSEPAAKKPFLPPRWVIHAAWRIHRGLYRVSGGRFGLRTPKADRYGLMRMTTIGRKTKQPRHVMLGYYEDGSDIVTMAMNGWGAAEPAWWLNLQASPDVEITLVDGPHAVTGRAATGDERQRLWARWQELDDNLDAYAELRPDETAVVILEPNPSA